MDWGLCIATLVLLGIGIVLVYSSSFAVAQTNFGSADFFLLRQLSRALLALVAFMVFINVDYRIWSKYSGVLLVVAVVLLIYVLTQSDSAAVKGAKRWMTLFGVRFQVSDFARMALILFLAKKLGNCSSVDFSDWRSLIPHYVCIGVICGLILLGPDFSTTMIILIVAFGMIFMAGAKVKHLLVTLVLTLPLAVIVALAQPYRVRRLASFKDTGYQVFQSLIGLGRGGVFGTGLGRGEQKYFFLPEPHTDFIITVLGEEFGFVGIIAVFMIFAFIVYRGFSISLNAPDRTGQLAAFGFTLVIAVYVLVHSSVAIGLVPPTGVPMPFLSYGGMSLIFTMSGMGILLNISSKVNSETRRVPAVPEQKRKKARA